MKDLISTGQPVPIRIERGAPQTVNLFDYVRDPLERSTVAALMRIYDIIPDLAQMVLNEMCDRLENEGMFRQNLKRDYGRIVSFLSPASRQNLKRYKDDETKHNCKTVLGEIDLQNRMLDDLSKDINRIVGSNYVMLEKEEHKHPNSEWCKHMTRGKLKAWLRRFVSMLAIFEGVSDVESLLDFKREIMDRAILMGQLEVNQQFIFATVKNGMDMGGQVFTYLGLFEQDIPGETDPRKKNVVCHYRKLSDSAFVVYIEDDCYRPVIPMPKTTNKVRLGEE